MVNMALQEQWEKVRESVPRAGNFLAEVWAELRKVHFPTRKETYAATTVVVIITILVATFLGVVDFIISHMVQAILS